MTTAQIEKKAARSQIPFRLATQIRQLLDEAKKAYGPTWDDDDMEDKVIELVTEEG